MTESFLFSEQTEELLCKRFGECVTHVNAGGIWNRRVHWVGRIFLFLKFFSTHGQRLRVAPQNWSVHVRGKLEFKAHSSSNIRSEPTKVPSFLMDSLEIVGIQRFIIVVCAAFTLTSPHQGRVRAGVPELLLIINPSLICPYQNNGPAQLIRICTDVNPGV